MFSFLFRFIGVYLQEIDILSLVEKEHAHFRMEHAPQNTLETQRQVIILRL